jgi:hypothetical protein
MELTPEERDRIFQARREAQERLKAEEKAKKAESARYGCLGCFGALVLLGAIIALVPKTETHHESTADTAAITTSVPMLSGNPVVAYHLKRSRWPVKAVCGTTSMNVIVDRPVSERELVDVALDLHARYPNTYFEILDDESRLRDFDQAGDLVNAKRLLGVSGVKALLASLKPWQEKHYLAAIALTAESVGFKWELFGSDAHPTKANEQICDLDTKTISTAECVAAAAKRVPR